MGNAVTIQCRAIQIKTGTVLFVGMQLVVTLRKKCRLWVFENGVLIPWFVCVCHDRDHSQINPDDLLRGNQLPPVCTGGWIHVLLHTQ
jgi:hypothetical protein